jgi:hypothetical protein
MKTKSRSTSGQKMIFIAGALFCLMLISVSLLSGLYARYISNGDGDDAARVAKFDVATTVHNVNAEFINKGETNNTYTIAVTNNSEVAVRCDLVLVFDSALEYINITVDGNAPSEISLDKKTFTFKDIALLAPNGATADCQLVFTVTDWNAVTSEADGASVTYTFGFDGTLYCTQID